MSDVYDNHDVCLSGNNGINLQQHKQSPQRVPPQPPQPPPPPLQTKSILHHETTYPHQYKISTTSTTTSSTTPSTTTTPSSTLTPPVVPGGNGCTIDQAYLGHEAILQTAATLQNMATNGDHIVNNRGYTTLQNTPFDRRSFDNRSLDCRTLGARSPGSRSLQRPLDPRNLDTQFIDTRTMDSRVIDSREDDKGVTECLLVDPNHHFHHLSHQDLCQVTTPHLAETMVPLTELPAYRNSLSSLVHQPNGSARPYGMPSSGSCSRVSRTSSQDQPQKCCPSCGCCKVFVSLLMCLAIFGAVVVALYFFIRCGCTVHVCFCRSLYPSLYYLSISLTMCFSLTYVFIP